VAGHQEDDAAHGPVGERHVESGGVHRVDQQPAILEGDCGRRSGDPLAGIGDPGEAAVEIERVPVDVAS
jgi:hypothetical protein